MKQYLMALVAATAFCAGSAQAADTPPASTTPSQGGYTLEEARKHAHEYADKLDKMTPDEWAKHQQKRKAWRDKWKSMTPDEKKAEMEKRRQWREEHKNSAAAPTPGGTPSGSTTTPAASGK